MKFPINARIMMTILVWLYRFFIVNARRGPSQRAEDFRGNFAIDIAHITRRYNVGMEGGYAYVRVLPGYGEFPICMGNFPYKG